MFETARSPLKPRGLAPGRPAHKHGGNRGRKAVLANQNNHSESQKGAQLPQSQVAAAGTGELAYILYELRNFSPEVRVKNRKYFSTTH
jgi:hypothetical protein